MMGVAELQSQKVNLKIGDGARRIWRPTKQTSHWGIEVWQTKEATFLWYEYPQEKRFTDFTLSASLIDSFLDDKTR